MTAGGRLALILALAGCTARSPRVTADPPLPGIVSPDAELGARLAAAAPPGVEVRTRHRNADGSPRYTNRLILEASPYLLQHAHNPVNWYPWGDEAFARARRERKPVLLSIGYSTCHWCHVMEEESFEDEEIAGTLNERYVSIKVDREEHPEIDSVYLGAAILMSGRGGWPLTLILTDERQPFFAATYIPARDGDRGAGKGFLTILREAAEEHRLHPDRATAVAQQATRRLVAAATPPPPADIPGPGALQHAVALLAESFDPDNGGFGRAPKFPMAPALQLLAREHRRTGDPQALHMLVHSLERMAAGGIHDQAGGGFHRYATDARWIVPHFEKMLYDNAQLASVYLDAFQLTGREDFAAVARDTLAAIDRELSLESGAFASATDADSRAEGGGLEEGHYFTWTPDELAAVLGPERARAAGIYLGVSERGHVDGRSVLYASMPLDRAAALAGMTPDALGTLVAGALPALRTARAARPAPRRDDKAVAAWNGLAISAFARAGLVLDDPAYLRRAERAAAAFLAAGPLRRELRSKLPALLDDHALFVQGLLDLHEATGDPRILAAAIAELDTLLADFGDADGGGFYRTPRGADGPLVPRDKPRDDGAEPSGNAVAILDLLRLHELTGDERYRRHAEKALRAFARVMEQGRSAAAFLAALDFFLDTPLEIVVVAPSAGGGAELLRVVARTYVPNRILVAAIEGPDLAEKARLVPLLAEKRALHGRATAYVCRRRSCDSPTSDPAVLAGQLAPVLDLSRPPAVR